MTSGYYCAIFSFCGGRKKKKKDDKQTKAFYDWATTGIPVKTHGRLKWDTLQNLRTLQASNVFHDELCWLRKNSHQGNVK